MAQLLRLAVVRVTPSELDGFERVIAVDHQPGDLTRRNGQRLAVLDHHPREEGCAADYIDVRPDVGATATLATQYLRADPDLPAAAPLATALLYGIKTDTAGLTRGVSPADVDAYAYLQAHADLDLLRRFERPSYPYETARDLGAALGRARMDRDLIVVWLGRLDTDVAHAAADLADLCMSVEGAMWAAVAARIDDRVVLTLRHGGGRGAAGVVAQRLAADGGSGGGHATMARVEWPAAAVPDIAGPEDADQVTGAVLRRVRAALSGRL